VFVYCQVQTWRAPLAALASRTVSA
jgi:hypothetical protein